MSIRKIKEPRPVSFAWNDLASLYDLGDYTPLGTRVQLRVETYWANTRDGVYYATNTLPTLLLDCDSRGRVTVPGDLVRRCFDTPEPPTTAETNDTGLRPLPGETVYWLSNLTAMVDGNDTGDHYVTRIFCALRGTLAPDRHAVGRDDWQTYALMQRLDNSLSRPLVVGQPSDRVRIVDEDEDVLLHIWPCKEGEQLMPLFIRMRSVHDGAWFTMPPRYLECGKVSRLTVSPRVVGNLMRLGTSYDVQLSYDNHFRAENTWQQTFALREVFRHRERLLTLDRYGMLGGIGCLLSAEGETEGNQIDTPDSRLLDISQRRTVYTATMVAWPGKRIAEAQLWPWLWLWLDGAWRQCTPLPGKQEWLIGGDPNVTERQLQFVMTGRTLNDYTGHDTTISDKFTPDPDEDPDYKPDTDKPDDDWEVVNFPVRTLPEPEPEPTPAPYIEPDDLGVTVDTPTADDAIVIFPPHSKPTADQ